MSGSAEIPEESERRQLWTLIAVFMVAAALQVGIAERQCLWADELFSLAIATGHSLEHPAAVARSELGDFVEPNHPVPAAEFRRYLRHESLLESSTRVFRAVLLSDTSPPLYYFLLCGWTFVFGTSDITLRLLSVACSLACFPFLVGIARRTIGNGAIIPVAVLFALSPLGLYYSTEARMYSLLWLCVLATTWASLKLYQHGGKIILTAVWIAASAAGFLTHYFFVFPWLAIVICLATKPGKFKRLHLTICMLVTVAVIAPWYANLPRSLEVWRVTKDWLNWRPAHFNRPVAALELVAEFFDGHAKYLWSAHRVAGGAALILFGFIAIAMVWRLRAQLFRPRIVLLWLPFAASCAGPLVFDLVRHTYTVAVPRYTISALPLAYLLAALGLAAFEVRTRIVLLLLIALAWMPNMLSVYCPRSRVSEPFREVAESVSEADSDSDLIFVHSIPSGVLGIARYSNGVAAMASWVEQLRNHPVPEAMHALTAGRRRILFVKIHPVGAPTPDEDWLRANAVVFQEKHMGAADIVEFRPNDAKAF